MSLLLIWNKKERLNLVKKLLKDYIDKNLNIDEIHYLLDLILLDTLNDKYNLFDEKFINLSDEFKSKYIDFYNDLPENEIDIDSSNYVLKKEFDLWIRNFYESLIKL